MALSVLWLPSDLGCSPAVIPGPLLVAGKIAYSSVGIQVLLADDLWLLCSGLLSGGFFWFVSAVLGSFCFFFVVVFGCCPLGEEPSHPKPLVPIAVCVVSLLLGLSG
jgi:hypothetical protein